MTRTFKEYIRKILPIPTCGIEVSEDGYKYKVKAFASVVNEGNVAKYVEKRLNKCKRVKSYSMWFNSEDFLYKYIVIEMQKI